MHVYKCNPQFPYKPYTACLTYMSCTSYATYATYIDYATYITNGTCRTLHCYTRLHHIHTCMRVHTNMQSRKHTVAHPEAPTNKCERRHAHARARKCAQAASDRTTSVARVWSSPGRGAMRSSDSGAPRVQAHALSRPTADGRAAEWEPCVLFFARLRDA